MNISSIVVLTLPEHTEQVVQDLKNSGLCDYHLHDAMGHIIITIEGESINDEMAKLKIIETMPHILAANMQMSYTEDELEMHKENIEHSTSVPHVLNDPTVEAQNMVYNGDLKKKQI